MAATYRTSAAGGSSSGTGNRTVAITPAVGDLLVIYCIVAANTNDTPTCSDNNGSGTYDRIDVMNATIASVNYRMSVFIRTALMANTTSTTVTVATGSNTSGVVHAIAVSGMSRTGADAVRSKGSQSNQAAGAAAPVLNQSALTGNLTIVACGSADTTTTAPTNWTERQDTSQTNDTVALETATRDSGFTGTTITFGAAQSTVFASHALELDSSALLARAAAIDGAGAVVSSATFFSVFDRALLVDGAGLVTAVGQRSLLRSTAIDITGSIESSGTFFSVFSGACALDGTTDIASSGIFFSVVTASTTIDVSAAIESSAAFFTILDRSVVLDGNAGISSSAIFFSVFAGEVLIDGAATITSDGEIQAGAGEFERTAVVNADGLVASDGLSILERSATVVTVGDIAVSVLFFSTVERAIAVSVSGSLSVAGQRDLLRSAMVSGVGGLSATGLVFTVFESSGEITTSVSIASAGVASEEFERVVALSATGIISVAGIPRTPFRVRKIFNAPGESRILSQSREDRTVTVEREQQFESI